jgi:mannose-6-phosphate isomerase class I
MNLYPLLMVPCFRHGADTPWGGDMLRDIFMKEAPDGTGESYEVCAVPERDSLVASGEHAGIALRRMFDLWGEALTGSVGDARALQLKLLDACGEMPVQTSPTASHGFVILNAEPGAALFCGDGWNPVRPGEVYYIPAGTAWALRGGVQSYAVECASGALAAPVKTEGATELCRGGSRTWYICDDGFELCRLNISGKMPLETGRMRVVTPMAPLTLTWAGGEMALDPFATVVVPAGLENAVIEGHGKALLAAPSDQDALRQALGYRAELVAGL